MALILTGTPPDHYWWDDDLDDDWDQEEEGYDPFDPNEHNPDL